MAEGDVHIHVSCIHTHATCIMIHVQMQKTLTYIDTDHTDHTYMHTYLRIHTTASPPQNKIYIHKYIHAYIHTYTHNAAASPSPSRISRMLSAMYRIETECVQNPEYGHCLTPPNVIINETRNMNASVTTVENEGGVVKTITTIYSFIQYVSVAPLHAGACTCALS
jgi:hypothetical protein